MNDRAEPRRRERKIVTVLFCDLVGFTSQAESMDPEDVEAMLRPYHDRVRAELERHGGTVEKFIGDAVMALFGAPIAHEDDPERAVRAALAIREFAAEQSLELRIGITTGEALVSLDASPAHGEGMASGDVVNTASRLQAAAPVNAILVDEPTWRATRRAVEYEEASAITAKGKSAPIPVWRARAARSRLGVDVAHHARTELIGRERELAMLRDAFWRATQDRTPQLVTLIGVPGMGKSRLVHELSRIADEDPRLITWRQGRCLAYGEGVAFWALSEMVKAQAGVLERDAEADVIAKLGATVRDVVGDPGDAAWVESHLRPLIGLEAGTGLGGDRRGEAFAAWRRFVEALAERAPLVLVFEDLHWADDGLLDFIDELVDWLSDVPLLVVCSARPELLERRPGWGGGKLNATTLGLAPLSEEQTSTLISQMLDHSPLPDDTQRLLLERAAGNPLYAEQFAQLYLERGWTDEYALPETLQGLVAARLDALKGGEKPLLQSAAVMGKVFWAGALEMDARAAAAHLHALERKGFVVRQRRSSVERDSEWSFAHMLLRDVAYAQIPRAERSGKHRRAAEWIASLGRPDDHAELLAHHWRAAWQLATAAGTNAVELVRPTRLALRAAGDRAFATHAHPAAAAYYADARELWPADDTERPRLLYRYADALYLAADQRALHALEVARDALLEAGDYDLSAEAEISLARIWWHRGQRDQTRLHEAHAEELVRGRTSAAAARVIATTARTRSIAGDREQGMVLARQALAMAEELDMDDLRAHALTTIGMCKRARGDASGIEDLERALQLAVDANWPEASTIANNLAVDAMLRLDPRRARELWDEGLRLAERFGDAAGLRWMRGQQIFNDLIFGDWDAASSAADAFIAESEGGSPHYLESHVRSERARIRVARGDRQGALEDHRRAIALVQEGKDPQQVLQAYGAAVLTLEQYGHTDEARRLANEVVPLAHTTPDDALLTLSLDFLFARVALEYEQQLREVLGKAPLPELRALALACLDRDFVNAADMWALAGSPTWEARLRLRAAEELVENGETAKAREQAQKAIAFYRSVNATAYLERIEVLLAGGPSA